MREVTVQNLRTSLQRTAANWEAIRTNKPHTYKQTGNQAANRQSDGNDVNDDVGGVVVQRDCATIVRT